MKTIKRRNAAALAVSPVLLLALGAPAPAIAQDKTPPTVTGIVAKDISGGSTLLPSAVLDFAPAEIVVTFSEDIDPATVSTETCRLVRSGGDGTFGDGNEVEILPGSVTLDGSSTQATMELTGATMTRDVYEVAVSGGDGPKAGLVGHWRLDETSGTTAYDSSGNANDGTLVNGPVWQPTGGKIGGALRFDGADDCVGLPDGLIWSHSELTLVMWIKTSMSGVAFGYQQNEYPVVPAAAVSAIYVDTAGSLRGEFWQGTASPIVSSQSVADGQWHHVALAGQGTSQMLYLNGALVGTLSGDIDHKSMLQNQIGIGDGHWAGCSGEVWDGFDGDIDDVRIYDRVLADAEIATLASPPPSAADLSSNPLDGDYSGSLPSGDGTPGGDFVCTFEITAPTVLGTSPGDEAGKVPVTATIEVIFSRAMDQASTEAALVVSGGVTGAKSWIGNTLVLTPDQPLEYSRYYTATVSTDAKDATGVPLADAHAFAFTTAAEPQPGGDDGGCAGASAGSPLAFLLPFVLLALAGRTRRRALSHD